MTKVCCFPVFAKQNKNGNLTKVRARNENEELMADNKLEKTKRKTKTKQCNVTFTLWPVVYWP